jgi:TatD DNase family protein
VIDTHAHLDACAEPADLLLARARAAGVSRVLTVGTGLASGRRALELARRHEEVFAIVGVHPHDAAGADADRLDELRALLADPHAVAVGETGLDLHRDHAPRDRQARLFEAQLELAADLDKPVVVHNRSADAETSRLLAGFPGTVVLHCFSSPSLLPLALESGWYVSFAGNLTYAKASELREAAAHVPADRLLAETDSPYLTPQPRRGSPNEPANVMHTLAALASARGEGEAEVERAIERNASAAFALP